jgi:hypothetical protein
VRIGRALERELRVDAQAKLVLPDRVEHVVRARKKLLARRGVVAERWP